MRAPVTRIIRFVSTDGNIYLGEEPAPGVTEAVLLSGDLYNQASLQRMGDKKEVAKLLAPLVPSAIFCIGLNYMKHWEESAKKRGIPQPEKPVIFMKPGSALNDPGGDVWMPRPGPTSPGSPELWDQLDWEVELTVVIGRACRNVKKEDALHYVLGYTVGNDVSSRHWQKNSGGGQWIKGKSFDTHAPIGPCLVTTAAIPDPAALRVTTRVNGQVQQDEATKDMIFSVGECIEWLSDNMTLLPGTVIMTGTPCGVAAGREPPNWLRVGDVVECEISQIGILRNTITLPPP